MTHTKHLEKRSGEPILGLILAGGRSIRMGIDKAVLCYHGTDQVHHLYNLLSDFCESVYVSIRKEQKEQDVFHGLDLIIDEYQDRGPMAGLFSAMKFRRDRAWLTVPIDMPNLASKHIQHLLSNWSPGQVALANRSRNNRVPDPLFAVYGPGVFSKIKHSLHSGNRSLRDIVNDYGEIIDLPWSVYNINTKNELDSYKGGII